MPELRQNLATKEWVIIATERAKRPDEFITKKEKVLTERPVWSESCPFCPKNEDKTPYETFVIRDDSGKWKVRAIPNKYPALVNELHMCRYIEGVKRYVSGVGIHEVIIESPIHNTTTALLPEEDVADIIRAYRNRYIATAHDERIKLVTIFKNHGEAAGTSIEHPHSQLISTPIVPQNIRNRVEEAMRYFDDHGECVFCKMISEEQKLQERVIFETGNFIAFIPYAALSPFHTWLLPKRHMSSFEQIDDDEVTDLARSLKTLLAKIYYGLDDPDYNYVLRSMPGEHVKNEYYHWYISIIPRLVKTAGFELGSGMYVNTSLPEENAKFLREVKTR